MSMFSISSRKDGTISTKNLLDELLTLVRFFPHWTPGKYQLCGDFTTGFETTLDVPPGAHLVTTQIQLGIVRNRTVEVTLEAGRHTVIILQYSRFWGNFTKKPQVFVE